MDSSRWTEKLLVMGERILNEVAPMPGPGVVTGSSSTLEVAEETRTSGTVVVQLEATMQTAVSEQKPSEVVAVPVVVDAFRSPDDERMPQHRDDDGTPIDDTIHALGWCRTLDSDTPSNLLFPNWLPFEERMVLQGEFEKHRGEIAKLQKEALRLREHLLEQEQLNNETILELQQQLEMGVSAASDEEVHRLESRISELELIIHDKDDNLTIQREIALNLQTALDTFEISKRTDIELACTQYMDAIKEVQERNASLEGEVMQAKQKATSLEVALQESQQQIQVLKKRTLEEQERKPVSPVQESPPSNSSIDRQVISGLLLHYFTANPSVKLDCLVLMTKVLEMSDLDRNKIGLEIKDGRWRWKQEESDEPEGQLAGESLADTWISFLLKEADSGSVQSEVDAAGNR